MLRRARIAAMALASRRLSGVAWWTLPVATTGSRRSRAIPASRSLVSSSPGLPWPLSSTTTWSRPKRRVRSSSASRAAPAPACCQCLSDRALAAAAEDHPVATTDLGEVVEVVRRPALLVAGQVRLGHRSGQPVIALHSPGQDQQMSALGVRDPVLRCAQAEAELGTEDAGKTVGGARLGEERRPGEVVVVGECQRTQAEPASLHDQVGGTAGTVEKAEVAVAVQLGVRRDGLRADDLELLCQWALAT